MARMLDGELYLSPQEASQMLHVSYKTLQRWADAGVMNVWTGTNGSRARKQKRVRIDLRYTAAGYRLYRAKSIERLSKDLAAASAAVAA